MATHDMVLRAFKLRGGNQNIIDLESNYKLAFDSGDLLVGDAEMQPSLIATNLADFTLTSGTSAQPIFEAARDTVTVEASTSYRMEALIDLATGTVSHATNLVFALGDGCTLTSIRYGIGASVGATEDVQQALSWRTASAATTQVVSTANTAAFLHIVLRGIIRVNAGGTITPQIIFSVAPAGTNVCKANSFFELRKFGTNTTGSVGSWA